MKVKVGTAVIIRNKKNEILLLKRITQTGYNTWAPPGGHLEFGEDIIQSAKREVLEETGLKLNKLYFKGITNDIFKKENKHYVTIWFEAKTDAEKIKLSNEHSKYGWFGSKYPSPLFLPFKNYLKKLIRQS